nr:hypothetical protein [Photorhabdus bodei]
MSQSITHQVSKRQWQFRVSNSEIGIMLPNVITGLADDLEVADHGILHQLVV